MAKLQMSSSHLMVSQVSHRTARNMKSSIILSLAVLCSFAGIGLGQYSKAKNCSIESFENSFLRAYGHFGSDRLSLPTSQAKLTKYCK